LNIHEDQWVEMLKGMLSEGLARYTGIPPSVFDELGPSLHVALDDADPVISLGSGDLLGAFGGGMWGGGGGMFWMPVVLSTFTRPTKFLVELRDAEAVLNVLRKASTLDADWDEGREFGARFYKVEGRDAWVYDFGFFGVISLRLGVEIRDDFLVLSNIPWSHRPNIAAVTDVPLNGALLDLNPGAGTRQLPGLFAAAAGQQRGSAMNGIGYLYPLLLAGEPDVETALAKHGRLFGFRPVHPPGGDWEWKGRELHSTVFGTATHQKQPEYREGNRAFGVLQGVERLSLNMQFEESGLRATCRWTYRKPR